MNRRQLLSGLVATASGLVLPYEPKRIYSFSSAVGRKPPDELVQYVSDYIRDRFAHVLSNHIRNRLAVERLVRFNTPVLQIPDRGTREP